MGGQNSYRTNQNLGDWMREMEKRMLHEERRPQIRTAADLLGPGIAPYTMETLDWSSPATQLNGFYFSQPGAVNSPDISKYWIGITQGTAEGAGYEEVHQFDPISGNVTGDTQIRFFYTPSGGGQPIYTNWGPYAAGGGPPTGTAGGDLTGTYPNPVIAPNSVDTTKIVDGTIGLNDLSAAAVSGLKPAVQDEGTQVEPDAALFNFVGAGVTAIQTASGQVQINIPGGGGSGPGTGSPPDVQVFGNAGSYTWTKPANAVWVQVEMVGGGGGGGGVAATSAGQAASGGGGGGGGYCRKTYDANALGNTSNVVVGAGGAGGPGGNNGGTVGGQSSFATGANQITASGGSGGGGMGSSSNVTTGGGDGGIGSSGDVMSRGGDGQTGYVAGTGSGNTAVPIPAFGGGTYFIGGSRSNQAGGSFTNSPGNAGRGNYGGGGSGAYSRDGSGNGKGGDGGSGVVIVTTHFGGAQGPTGPQGPAYTPYKQDFGFASALTTWTIAHNQNRKSLSVYAVDTNGDELVAEVLYPDNNTITLTHYYATTGTATVYG